ncbi:hypothetical protein QOZ88_06700 [Blastococcus sp. BMG 814]|uniref:HEPN domain-containing protein n=1 Tax=Blastococcus carthaginiensis TaxID=3050034 RepID=A0ABT9IAQ5_9ACTN|nr:hypothetical protein [Blastococcus carthaginiensis]MDP5182322.1 hypothetical protein [Blastococcus carthaginiensis]
MDDDSYSDGHVWPVPGLNILSGGNAHRFHAFLQWQHSPDMSTYPYVAGFRLAAELMFKHVKQTGQDQDMILFPFGMCWRHHVELQLKSLLMELQRYQREPVKAPATHDLQKLWRDVRRRLEATSPNDTGDLDAVEDLLLQLHDTDRTNQEFRYSTRNDKTPSLGRLPWIDLAAFHDSMLRLSNFFNAAGTATYEDGRVRDEYEQWMREEYAGYEDY